MMEAHDHNSGDQQPIPASNPDSGSDIATVATGDIQLEKAGDLAASVVNTGTVGDVTINDVTNNYLTPSEKPPAVWFGVPTMPNYFVGREALVEQLTKELVDGDSLALSADGLPGVGKTALAVALAHRKEILAHFIDGVLWAGLGPQADALELLNGWATALGRDISELVTVKEREAAVKALLGQRRILVVIDDAWEVEVAQALRCGGPNCRHLLTTRDKGLARQFAGVHHMTDVPPLANASSLLLLRQLAPEAYAADPEKATSLAEAVGGLPLALELLGGYLAAPERSLFADLSQAALDTLLEPAGRLQLAAARLGGPGQRVTLQETIALSLESLRASGAGQAAEQAFYALGAFAPKPERFSRAAAEAVGETDATTLALLVARNLVEKSGEQLLLHQTIADVARTKLDEAAVTRHREHYLALVNEDRHDWRRIESVYGQLQHAWQVVPEDLELLELVWALRLYQHRRGLRSDQLEWMERALRLAEAKGWRKDEATLLNNIGGVYDDVGQRQEALAYYNRALPIYEEVGDRSGLATTLNNIGLVYDNLGQREEALAYYNRALSIREEVGDRSGLAITLTNIGVVYNKLGQREEALAYYNRARPIYEEVGDRSGLATTLNNIGLVYDNLGQREEALAYYNRALPIREEVGDRSGLAITLTNIGVVYNALGQREEALAYYNRALPIKEEVGDRSGLAVTLSNIGLVYSKLGQREKALAYYNRALSIQEEVGDRSGLAVTLNNIGLVYSKLGHREEALVYYNRALPIQEEVGDRSGLAVSRFNVAMIHRANGHLEKAVAELKQVVILDKLVQHPDLESDMQMLAKVEAELAASRK